MDRCNKTITFFQDGLSDPQARTYYNLGQNLLIHITNLAFFVLILTKMLTVVNWKAVSPSPIPVLFAVTQEMHMWAVRPKQLWTGVGRAATLLCWEIVAWQEIKKILRNVSTGLSGVAATERQALKLTFFAFCMTLCAHLTNLLFGKSRINNKHNTINSEGCLSNVSRHNTLATNGSIGSFRWSRVKDALLLSRRKSRIKRNAA